MAALKPIYYYPTKVQADLAVVTNDTTASSTALDKSVTYTVDPRYQSNAQFGSPARIAVDSTGNLFVADSTNNRIRKITPDGVVSTFAGSGSQGSTNGIGAAASFYEPMGVALDTSGNLFVADGGNHLIRKIVISTGQVSTFAGSGSIGSNNATGTAASFNSPRGMALDTSGNMFVADVGNHRIRKIVLSTGAVSTLAGGTDGYTDTNPYNSAVLPQFRVPNDVAVDTSGNLFVADYGNNCIRQIVISTGEVSTLAGSGSPGFADGLGGGAEFDSPSGVVVDTSGNVIVSDSYNQRIRKIDITGDVSTIAGDGYENSSQGGRWQDGIGTAASFSYPIGLAFDASGNLFVADSTNYVFRKITPSMAVSTIAGTPGVSGYRNTSTSLVINWNIGWNSTGNKTRSDQLTVTTGDSLDASGTYFLYPEDSGNAMYYFASEADASGCLINSKNDIPVTVSKSLGVSRNYTVGNIDAMFKLPKGVALDTSGNLFVADRDNHLIRKVTPGGVVTTFAGDGYSDGLGNGRWVDAPSGPATAASFNTPSYLALDTSGNLFVADTRNNRIRKIVISTGVVSTFAGGAASGFFDGAGSGASFSSPEGITIDTSGNMFVADVYNHSIRKIVISSASVTTIAGTGLGGYLDSSGTNAQFRLPRGVCLDTNGNLYIADTQNHCIRKIVLSSGDVTTIAGSGSNGFADGIGSAASFNEPTDVVIDTNGNIVVADGMNNCIRLVDPTTTQVTTLAGTGAGTFLDAPSGPGSAASFNRPAGMAVDATGVLFVADALNNRIRQINIRAGTVTTLAGAQAGFKNNNITLPSSQWSIASNSPGLVNSSVTTSGSDITNPHGTYFLYPYTAPPAPAPALKPIYYFSNKAAADTVDPTDDATISSAAIDSSLTYTIGKTATEFNVPSGVAFDTSGNMFVADTANNRIRKIVISTGVVTTLAGSGNAAFADGTGTTASFSSPYNVALDTSGNLFVSDRNGNRIRKIVISTGVVTTLAGSGSATFADGTGAAASFSGPAGIDLDTSGNLFVADFSNQRIRKIVISTGLVTTLAGSGSAAFADSTGAGASFNGPNDVAVDASGNVYVGDTDNNRIRKIVISSGAVSTLAGSGAGAFLDGTGTAADLYAPMGVALDMSGNLFVAEFENNRIRKIVISTAVVSTLAGSTYGFADGTGVLAKFAGLTGVAVDAIGNVFVAENDNNTIRKVTPAGVVTTIAGTPTTSGYKDSIPAINWNIGWNSLVTTAQKTKVNQVTVNNLSNLDASGTYFLYPAGSGNAIYYFASQADASGCLINTDLDIKATMTKSVGVSRTYTVGNLDAMFSGPIAAAVDTNGNVFVADQGNNRIRKVTPGGVVTTLAGSGGMGFQDNTGILADFNTPGAVAVDASGNVFVADNGNHRIRKVTPSGVVTTLAGSTDGFLDATGATAQFSYPSGVALDTSGNLFVADQLNNRIRKIVISTGVVTTLAGSGSAAFADGTGASASFRSPAGLTLDTSGNVFVTDLSNFRIRKIVISTGVVTTLAGSGVNTSTDGIGAAASFAKPSGITVHASGNLFVAQVAMYGAAIRKISPPTGLTWDSSGAFIDASGSGGGIVTTFAGSGLPLFSDAPSGPGSVASFNEPSGVTIDPSGNLIVTDRSNAKIRKVNLSTGAVTTLAGAQSGFKNNNITLPSSQWRVASNSPGLVNTNVTSNGNTIINPHGTYFLYPSAICFLEGTTVLCFVNGSEEYVPVEKLDKETLVKTLRDGYKKIDMIAKQELFNPGTDERIEQRLYKCSTSRYPELTSDLYLTGCHSILVNTITDDERMKLTKQLGRIFVTDRKYRLTAFVDERTEPWNSEGKYTVWHFALEHENIMMNYGIFVNGGLLVESCSKHVLKNKSDMVFQ